MRARAHVGARHRLNRDAFALAPEKSLAPRPPAPRVTRRFVDRRSDRRPTTRLLARLRESLIFLRADR